MHIQELIKEIALKLNKYQIPYMIIGGQAALIYREPRFTNDIDITLGVDIDKLDVLLNIAIELDCKVLVDNINSFVSETMVLPTIDKKTGFRVEFIFSYSNYEKEAISRAKKVNIDNIDVNFCSLEDLIIFKMIAGRARDIEDIIQVLIKNDNCDIAFIENKLKEFDFSLNSDYKIKFLEILTKIKKDIEF